MKFSMKDLLSFCKAPRMIHGGFFEFPWRIHGVSIEFNGGSIQFPRSSMKVPSSSFFCKADKRTCFNTNFSIENHFPLFICSLSRFVTSSRNYNNRDIYALINCT